MGSELERKLAFLEQDPTNANLLADIADNYIRLGEFTQAQAYIDQGLSINNQHLALQFVQSTLALALNDPDTAIALLKTLKKNNSAEAVIYNLAYAYMLKGKPEKAKFELLAIIDLPQLMPSAWLLFARVCHHLGEMDEAKEAAEKYIEQCPSDPEGVGVLAFIKVDMQAEDAEEWADKALVIDANNVEALLTQGSIALNEVNLSKAVPHFEKAVSVKPSSGRAHAGLGLIHMANNDLQSARQSLETAVINMPNHIGTWHALAWSQILMDDLNAAKESFDKANTIDRNFGETYGGLAVIAVRQGQLDKAKGLIRKAFGLNSRSFAARYAQTLIITKTGGAKGNEKALVMIDKILDSKVGQGASSLKELLIQLQQKR